MSADTVTALMIIMVYFILRIGLGRLLDEDL